MTSSGKTHCMMQDNTSSFIIKTTQNKTEEAPFRIFPSGIKTLPMQPSFSAYLDHFINSRSSTQDPLTKLIFDHVESNIGGHYNPIASHFIAPVNGTYLFNVFVRVTMIPDTISSMTLRLNVGNQSFDNLEVVNRERNYVRTLSLKELVMMKAGEIAQAVIVSSFPVNIFSVDGQGTIPRTTFEGRLLA